MTNDIKLVASLQYIQNAIDNVKLTNVNEANKEDIIELLTITKTKIKNVLDNE